MSVICDPDQSNCQSFQSAFQQVGDAFYEFCESSKICYWQLTTGPILKDINTRSIVAVAINHNNFPVKIQINITQIDGSIIPYYCDDMEIPACSSKHFKIIDMNSFQMLFYSISFFITKSNGAKVCDKVRVYAAARSDYVDVAISNSHVIPAEVFYHSMFVVKTYDEQCKPICPIVTVHSYVTRF